MTVAGGKSRSQLRKAWSRKLAKAAVEFRDAAYHDRRGANESTAVKWWRRWCAASGRSVCIQATVVHSLKRQLAVENQLCMFATWLRVERAVAPRTVAGYVSTVLAWHRRQFGEVLPDGQAHRLRAVLRGMRRDAGQGAQKHRAVTPQAVARIVKEMLDASDVGMVTLCAATAVAFCGLLRVSEFCVKAGRDFDGAILPEVRELRDCGDEMAFDIWPRKKGAKVRGKEYCVSVRDGSRLQPVSLLRRMRVLRRSQRTWGGAMPMFMVGGRALDELTMNKFLKAACVRLGMPVFTAHSLRVGGATAAMAAGVDPETIKVLGRWDSGAYKVYCRLSRQAAMRLSRAVASADVSLAGVMSG